MKSVTDSFKIDLRTYGRQLDPKVKINDEDFDTDDLNYIKPAFNTSLFKTIMHQVEIDSNVYMIKDTKIYIKLGVKVNQKNYEYVELGTYYVKSCERQEDTNSYRIIAYTKMKNSMIDYDLNIVEKITLRDYLIRICQRLGWNTNNIPAVFVNSTKLVSPVLHTGIKYTFRDALDEIATLSCSFLLFKNDDFYLKYLTQVDVNIDESYLDEDNITIGEKYFINSLVFSRAEESDNIYRKNDTSITLNGLHEYKISDCQLLSTNDRSDYIDEMFNYLKTLEFYTFDIQSKGILFLEACDMFNIVLNKKTYVVGLLNDEINIEDGLTETLYTEEPTETETDYKYADSTDKKINQTYIIVDKQNQKIESTINNVTEQNQKIAQITQTVNELNSKISDVADITTFKESNRGELNFEKINASEPIYVEIRPLGENISYLYPFEQLYVNDNLFIKLRTLKFTNTTTSEIFYYELPDDLLYYNEDNFDSFIMDYDSQSILIKKKCKYNKNGQVELLNEEIIKELEFEHISITDGDYKVEILKYDNTPYLAYLGVRLMSQNIYTTQFATKAEVNSEISQSAQSISLSVDKKLTLYPTTTQMNSAINIKANEITSTVMETYETKENANTNYSKLTQTANSISSEVSKKVGDNEIISKINQSAEAVSIDANKINLNGKTLNLTSDNMTIKSTNFNVDKSGNMSCSTANITGGKINLAGGTKSKPNFKVSDSNDSTSIIPGTIYLNDGVYANNSNGAGYIYVDSSGGGLTINNKSGSGTYIRPTYVKTPKLEQTSLESEKKNFEKFENAIDIIENIDIYKYNLKCEDDGIKKHIGFVIGNKYNYSKEITSENNDGVDIYSFVSLCCQAIKELNQENKELKKRLGVLENG